MIKVKSKRISENFDTIILIRIPKWLKDKMRLVAVSKGLSLSALTRMWLMEELQRI